MEIVKPFNDFFEAIHDDPRICACHITLYFALLHKWNMNENKNPMLIRREELMKAAKINSRQTYNKRMSELNEYGYIRYMPSLNPIIGSKVHLNFR